MAEVVAVAGLILSAVGTASSISRAQDQKKEARKQRRLQEQQAELQRQMRENRMRREARLRRARQVAQQGATGVSSSLVEGGLVGIETALSSNIELSQQQGRIQSEQFENMMNQSVSQANAQIGQAVGSFAAQALAPAAGVETGATNIEQAFGVGRAG